MPAFWWHFLVSGRMSSLPLTRLTHTEWSWYDRLWSLPHCLSLLLFPQWTSAYVDPHPPWKSRTKIHEMRCQILLSLWHGGEKKKKFVTEKGQKKKKKQAKLLAMMRSVWVQFTTDGHVNLPSIQYGQAFTVGRHQMRLRSQIAPWGHFTL